MRHGSHPGPGPSTRSKWKRCSRLQQDGNDPVPETEPDSQCDDTLLDQEPLSTARAEVDAPVAPGQERPRKRDRLTYALLGLITLLGLALRVWGIAWSLPDNRHPLATYHPD